MNATRVLTGKTLRASVKWLKRENKEMHGGGMNECRRQKTE